MWWDSFARALTYRFLASFFATPLIVYYLTGDLKLGIGIGFGEILFKTVLHTTHDWLWCKYEKQIRGAAE